MSNSEMKNQNPLCEESSEKLEQEIALAIADSRLVEVIENSNILENRTLEIQFNLVEELETTDNDQQEVSLFSSINTQSTRLRYVKKCRNCKRRFNGRPIKASLDESGGCWCIIKGQ